ncbi:hypothetical protein ACWDR9_22870, partial [Streptosporangium sandarakinum]
MRRLTGPAVLAALTLLVPPPPAGASSPAGRQAAFARAALRYGVPESVLLAVSYLESRWDAHDGLPSVSAGYGPMHLVVMDRIRAAGFTGGTGWAENI